METKEQLQQSVHEKEKDKSLEELETMITVFSSNCKEGVIQLGQAEPIGEIDEIYNEDGEPENLTQDVIRKKQCILQFAKTYVIVLCLIIQQI